MTKKEEIQKGIKTLLETMSWEELAFTLGISGSTLRRYRDGTINNPKWSVVKTIRKLLGGK